MRNNVNRLVRQLESLNLEGVVRVWEDDGNVGVVVRDENLNEVVRHLQGLNLPSSVSDGHQEGSVWVSNESRSVNQELLDFDFLS